MNLHADVLLITVNRHETDALLRAFKEVTGLTAKPTPIRNRIYHDLGTLNGARVFHALSEMGSGGVGATQQVVERAIKALSPDTIIAVGIAFGVSAKDQKIGDILVSKHLRPYELQRVGASGLILRDSKPPASSRLVNFFSAAQISWKGARVRFGVLLSGEKLIDNLDYRDQLIKLEPEAIGGEMEGAGLYTACHDPKKDWIVIKAICDWGDGEKSKEKTARQRKAAKNAVRFLVHAMAQTPLVLTPEGPHSPLDDHSAILLEETHARVQEMHSEIQTLREVKALLVDRPTISDRERDAISVLIEQATIHHQRGLDKQSEEEYQASIAHLLDALNLLRKVDPDAELRGRILIPLAGAEAQVGKFTDAMKHYDEALPILERIPVLEKLLWYAKAGRSLILCRQQRYEEAEAGLRAALAHFEARADGLEILRTLTHLVELNLNRHTLADTLIWARRLHEHTDSKAIRGTISAELVSALGALASVNFAIASEQHELTLLRESERDFANIEEMAMRLDLDLQRYTAMSQRARCLWYQRRYHEATALFETLIKATGSEFGKLAADSEYNYAIMMHEQHNKKEAIRLHKSALRRYEDLGDTASAEDARRELRALAGP